MAEPPPLSSTVYVTGLDPDTDDEIIEYFFSNRRRNGGGPVDRVVRDVNRESALVHFVNHRDAASVVKKGNHKLCGSELHVNLHEAFGELNRHGQNQTRDSPAAVSTTISLGPAETSDGKLIHEQLEERVSRDGRQTNELPKGQCRRQRVTELLRPDSDEHQSQLPEHQSLGSSGASFQQKESQPSTPAQTREIHIELGREMVDIMTSESHTLRKLATALKSAEGRFHWERPRHIVVRCLIDDAPADWELIVERLIQDFVLLMDLFERIKTTKQSARSVSESPDKLSEEMQCSESDQEDCWDWYPHSSICNQSKRSNQSETQESGSSASQSRRVQTDNKENEPENKLVANGRHNCSASECSSERGQSEPSTLPRVRQTKIKIGREIIDRIIKDPRNLRKLAIALKSVEGKFQWNWPDHILVKCLKNDAATDWELCVLKEVENFAYAVRTELSGDTAATRQPAPQRADNFAGRTRQNGGDQGGFWDSASCLPGVQLQYSQCPSLSQSETSICIGTRTRGSNASQTGLVVSADNRSYDSHQNSNKKESVDESRADIRPVARDMQEKTISDLRPWQVKIIRMTTAVEKFCKCYPGLEIAVDEESKTAYIRAPGNVMEKAFSDVIVFIMCLGEIRIPLNPLLVKMFEREDVAQWIQKYKIDTYKPMCHWELHDEQIILSGQNNDLVHLKRLFKTVFTTTKMCLDDEEVGFVTSSAWTSFLEKLQTAREETPAPFLLLENHSVNIVDTPSHIRKTRSELRKFLDENKETKNCKTSRSCDKNVSQDPQIAVKANGYSVNFVKNIVVLESSIQEARELVRRIQDKTRKPVEAKYSKPTTDRYFLTVRESITDSSISAGNDGGASSVDLAGCTSVEVKRDPNDQRQTVLSDLSYLEADTTDNHNGAMQCLSQNGVDPDVAKEVQSRSRRGLGVKGQITSVMSSIPCSSSSSSMLPSSKDTSPASCSTTSSSSLTTDLFKSSRLFSSGSSPVSAADLCFEPGGGSVFGQVNKSPTGLAVTNFQASSVSAASFCFGSTAGRGGIPPVSLAQFTSDISSAMTSAQTADKEEKGSDKSSVFTPALNAVKPRDKLSLANVPFLTTGEANSVPSMKFHLRDSASNDGVTSPAFGSDQTSRMALSFQAKETTFTDFSGLKFKAPSSSSSTKSVKVGTSISHTKCSSRTKHTGFNNEDFSKSSNISSSVNHSVSGFWSKAKFSVTSNSPKVAGLEGPKFGSFSKAVPSASIGLNFQFGAPTFKSAPKACDDMVFGKINKFPTVPTANISQATSVAAAGSTTEGFSFASLTIPSSSFSTSGGCRSGTPASWAKDSCATGSIKFGNQDLTKSCSVFPMSSPSTTGLQSEVKDLADTTGFSAFEFSRFKSGSSSESKTTSLPPAGLRFQFSVSAVKSVPVTADGLSSLTTSSAAADFSSRSAHHTGGITVWSSAHLPFQKSDARNTDQWTWAQSAMKSGSRVDESSASTPTFSASKFSNDVCLGVRPCCETDGTNSPMFRAPQCGSHSTNKIVTQSASGPGLLSTVGSSDSDSTKSKTWIFGSQPSLIPDRFSFDVAAKPNSDVVPQLGRFTSMTSAESVCKTKTSNSASASSASQVSVCGISGSAGNVTLNCFRSVTRLNTGGVHVASKPGPSKPSVDREVVAPAIFDFVQQHTVGSSSIAGFSSGASVASSKDGGSVWKPLIQIRRQLHAKRSRGMSTTEKYHPDNNIPNHSIPEHWNPHTANQFVQVVPLSLSSAEYQRVEANFRASLGHTTLTLISIDRIQNRTLYLQYAAKKAQLEKQNSGIQNERTLWHGTASYAVESINNYGFNRSYSGKNATAYGQGAYFSVSADYAAQTTYAPPDPSENRRIYQCKVLVGHATNGHSDMRVLPARQGPVLYDSATNDVDKPALFVIFNDTQAYPEYIITFKGTLHVAKDVID